MGDEFCNSNCINCMAHTFNHINNYVIFSFPPPIGEVLSHKPTASTADSWIPLNLVWHVRVSEDITDAIDIAIRLYVPWIRGCSLVIRYAVPNIANNSGYLALSESVLDVVNLGAGRGELN